MKSKLAVFDFDLTIRDPDPGNDYSYGVSHLFPGGKLPEELIEIRKKQGSKTLFETLVPLVNKMGLTKKELEDCFAYKNGSIIDKMDEVLKVLYDDHDIVMITGNSRAYTDNFLKRYGLFELFEEIFAHPETITDQGKIHLVSFLYFIKKTEVQKSLFVVISAHKNESRFECRPRNKKYFKSFQ